MSRYDEVVDKLWAYETALDAFLAAKGDAIKPALAEFCRHNYDTVRLVADHPDCYFLIRSVMSKISLRLDAALAVMKRDK